MKQAFTHWLQSDPAVLSTLQRTTHSYVIGQPGTGKSKALESWAMQGILAGHGVGVIDPHGDLFQNLVARLSAQKALWERVIIIDPLSSEWVVNINPLHHVETVSRQRLALFLTDIIVKIWGVNPATAPRMVWLMTNSFLALSDLGLTLLDLPRFLLDRPFREQLLPRLTREPVLSYFYLEFPQTEAGVRQWVTPVLNKLGPMLYDEDIRPMLASGPALDFRSILDDGTILLVNLSKGLLGEGASALLGAFLVAQLQKAALSRADTRWRQPYYLYLDEFQHYTTDNIQDVLSESRKYRLSLTLAHQYLEQLTPNLRHAVLNTAGTVISFRVGYQDAAHLAREIFPASDFLAHRELRLRQRGFVGRGFITLATQEQRLTGWDGLARQLANLPYRQFWSRSRGSRLPVHQRTLDIPDMPLSRDRLRAIEAFRAVSGQRFGQLKHEVQATLRGQRSHHPTPAYPSQAAPVDVPFWGG